MRRRQNFSSVEATDARILWREELELNKEGQKWLRVKALNTDEFHVIKRLGGGCYGSVKLVKDKSAGNLYAMKAVLREAGLESERVIRRLNSERTLLMEVNSVWVERMFHSFQDSHFLFLLLEYLPGGSLEELLHEEGNLLEYQARFYGAEMLMAINVIHRHGFMHRNIKPSNFLFDQFGHLKITDFSSSFRFLPAETCVKMAIEASIRNGKPFLSGERRDRVQIYQRKSTQKSVGSIYFMAPEVVRPGKKGLLSYLKPGTTDSEYSFVADFWSFGVCIYYLLFGQRPFVGDSSKEIRDKILNWRKNLSFPVIQPISDEAKDLIKSLIRDEPYRLGFYGCEDVMSHVFFEDTDWLHLRDWPVSVPFQVEGEDSTRMIPPACLANLFKMDNFASSNGHKELPPSKKSNLVDNLKQHSCNGPRHTAGNSSVQRPDVWQQSVNQSKFSQSSSASAQPSCEDNSNKDEMGSSDVSVSTTALPSAQLEQSGHTLLTNNSIVTFSNVSDSSDGKTRVLRDQDIQTWLTKAKDINENTDDSDDVNQEKPNTLEKEALKQLSSQKLEDLSRKKEQFENETGVKRGYRRCPLM